MQSPVSVRTRIIGAVERAASAEGFMLTAEQRAVLGELLDVAGRLASRSADTKGLYVWGNAGRGKSWLVDTYFHALPVRKKARVHFHGFLEALQRRIHTHRPAADAVQRAIAELTDNARVLYFDEFQVHDSGDAVLLTRLLEHLADTDTVLFATSNHPPTELMAESPWRHVVTDAVRVIESRMGVVQMPGVHDLRADIHVTGADSRRSERAAFAAGTRKAPASSGAAFAQGAWLVDPDPSTWVRERLRVPDEAEHTVLHLRGRDFAVLAVRRSELWISFAQLCTVPTSPIEYLDWVGRFRCWIITDVPSFAGVDAEAQQRFITVIDVLSDAGTRVVVSSQLDPAEFRAAAGGRPEAFRMLSRVQMLRTVRADGRLAR